MKKLKVIYSPRLLNAVLFRNLKQLEKATKKTSKNDVIPYAHLYEKLCRNFSIKKRELMEMIGILRDNDLVYVSQSGIKLNFEVIE